MTLALYCPDFGYYEQSSLSPGRTGDFYTSVSVGSLFGHLLAWQFADWLEGLGGGQLQIVEAGAHDGRLALDILEELHVCRPALAASIEYWILEPSQSRRPRQEAMLGNYSKHVRWFESWDALPSQVRGIIFSNELLDAMPVHRLGWGASRRKWFEWGVDFQGDEFVWARMRQEGQLGISGPAVGNLPKELLDVLPDGFTTEVSTMGIQWWRQAAGALAAGKLMTLDYGLMAEEFFTPERKDGTLRAYYQHHPSNNVLARPGEQDITAQVNFSAIRAAGEAAGLESNELVTQRKFLTQILERPGKESFLTNWTSNHARQFQTLTHPEHLGRNFRVLVQSR